MYDREAFMEAINMDDIKKLYDSKSNEKKTVPPGTYIAAPISMIPGESKNGKQMLKITWEITDGELKGCRLYQNQFLTSTTAIQIACKFLNAMGTGVHVNYETQALFAAKVNAMMQVIKGNIEYDLKYYKNAKGFDEYQIVGIYDMV